ncbi:MAG: sulfatase-like hydrolase/transferase [Myxococcota bacterium]|nr:sulfatase-like hydrolase/transferase [Myxococcota bacterium]
MILLWALWGCEARLEAPKAGPHVAALLTVDSWRLDHFTPELTPNLWALGEQGEVYEQAWSPVGLTTPAHVTMLTGRMPWEHGVEGNNHHGYELDPSITVLPELYEGWATGAFVSAWPAGPAGGLDRGWEVFRGPESGERPGQEAVQEALAWLPDDRPSLLWVHVYEPHGPYEGEGATERERYREEVARVDADLAPLIEELQARRALIVLTADHGEVLDEETCAYQHERSSSDAVLRVPLVRWYPDIESRTEDDWVGLADIPRLLHGETVPARDVWLAESGMCEADCAPGCRPEGLAGRDRVVVGPEGRWIDRPGRGILAEGSPRPGWKRWLETMPPVASATVSVDEEAARAAEALGYTSSP